MRLISILVIAFLICLLLIEWTEQDEQGFFYRLFKQPKTKTVISCLSWFLFFIWVCIDLIYPGKELNEHRSLQVFHDVLMALTLGINFQKIFSLSRS